MKLDIHFPEIDRLNAKIRAVSEKVGPTEMERLEAKIQTMGERIRPKAMFRQYTVEDVLNPRFMTKHTDFPDLPSFLAACKVFPDGMEVIDDENFDRLIYNNRERFDEFVRENSRTNDWASLRTLAVTEFVETVVELGLLMIVSGI